MKTLKYIIPALAIWITSSCSDLTREDYNQIYPENFFKTENDLRLAVNNLYTTFGSSWSHVYGSNNQGYQIFTEITTDALWCTWGWEWDALHRHEWYADKNGGEMSIFYDAFERYNYLSSTRNTIRRIEASTAPEEAKRLYAAEARALRGWMGLYLYDLFGPVPVAPDEVLDNPEQFVYLPKLTEAQYEKFMEDDLLAAIEDLPNIASAKGRLTKGAARMILLKYYMIRKDFQKAEPIARDLLAMEGNTYSLQLDYQYVFSKEGMGNNEIILQIPTNVISMPNYWTAHAIPDDYPYPVETASTYGAFIIPWNFMDTFESNDKRLGSIITSYTNKSGRLVERGTGKLQLGAVPAKYGVDPEIMGSATGLDVVVYRFADVLLTLAECINENNGAPTEEAILLVNRVRKRAGLEDLPSVATVSNSAFNEAILLERGHEFFAEGLRRQDLIRHDKYIEYAALRAGNQTAAHKTRFPIPLTFITESKDAILQNADY